MCGLAFLLALALYAPSLGHGLVSYDGPQIYLGQPGLFDHDSLVAGLRAIVSNLPREEPLLVRDLSWLVDSLAFGFGNPFGLHLGNVLLHALVCALVCRVLLRLGFSVEVAAVATLLYTLHPIHVEPVAWVMGRKDLLSTVFALLALDAWLSVDRSQGARRWAAFGLSVGLLGLGMLSKINLLGMPLLFGAATWSRAKVQGRPVPRSTYALLLAHVTVVVLVFGWYRAQVAAYGVLGRGPPALSAVHLEQLLTLLPEQIATFAIHFLVPWDYGLFYDRPAVGVPARATHVALGWGLVIAAGVGLALAYRRRPQVFFLGLGLCLSLGPYLNLVYIGVIDANRYLYLPSIFGCGLVAIAGVALSRRRPTGRAVVMAVGASWLLVAVAQHVVWLPAWADDMSLFEYEISRPEPSLFGIQGRVRTLVRRAEATSGPERDADLRHAMGLVQQGYRQYESLEVDPVPGYYDYQTYYLSKLHQWEGRILAASGAPGDRIIAAYERALALAPGSRLNLYLLAHSYSIAAHHEEDEAAATRFGAKSLGLLRRYAARIETPRDVERIRRVLGQVARAAPSLDAEVDAFARRLAELTPRSPASAVER